MAAAKDKLRVSWSKREKDIQYHYPLGSQTRSDGHYLHAVFGVERPVRCMLRGGCGEVDPSFVAELRDRGYDVSTLRFSIEKDPNHPRWKPQPG